MVDGQLSFLPPAGKRCSKCKVVKAHSEFYTLRGKPHGPCRDCVREYNVAFYASNSEQEKALSKAWRQANPEKVKQNRDKWEVANPDKVRISDRNRRRKRPQLSRTNALAWKKRNPDKNTANSNRRRAAKLRAIPKWVNRAYHVEMEGYYQFCKIFGGFEVDHIMPLQGDKISGFHSPNNLQILTPEENYRKGNRMPDPATIAPYIERPLLKIDADGFASLEFPE